MFSGFATTGIETWPVISSPNPSSPPNLEGLFVMRRIVVMPRSFSICAPMPYSRPSTGSPSATLACTVSRPCSCRLYARILWPNPMPRPSWPRK